MPNVSRARRGLVGLSIAGLSWLILAAGCGGGSSSKSSADDVCESYYDVLVVDCPSNGLPDSEVSRLRPRFLTACRDLLATPGEGVTVSALTACTAALKKIGGCSSGLGVADECRFPHGTLAAGAPCQDGGQCLSGACQRPVTSADAGTGNPACGVCADGTPAAVGQPCPVGTAGCVDGASCTAADPSTCAPIVLGDVGATCDFATSRCKTGLLCDPDALACIRPTADGATCTSTAQCAPGLICRAASTQDVTLTCQSPIAKGQPCSISAECGKGLGCTTDTLQCVPLAWASAGQPCSDLMPCLVGVCTASGVCPQVIADGQPCDAASADAKCDTLAACLDGICQLEGTPSCH